MKKLLRLLLTGLKWLVLAAVALEVFCFLIVTAGNYLIYGHAYEGSRMVYDPHPLFLSEFGPRPTHHNPAGPSPRTIWMFGGSTMRGSTERDEATIPSYLAAILNRPGSPFPCTVVNFGEHSFNSLLETKYLQKLFIESLLLPDLIIFYDGANDCTYFAQHRTPYGHYGYRRLRAAIENYRRSFFGLLKPLNALLYASFTKEVYDKMMQVGVPLAPGAPELKNLTAMTGKRYEHVRKMAECYGASFMLVWQPILWVETGDVAPQVREQERKYAIQKERFLSVRHNFAVTYRALAEALRDRPYFYNFQNALCSRSQPVYEADGVHLNDAGDELVAKELAMIVEARWQEKR